MEMEIKKIKLFYACSPSETDKKFLIALKNQLSPVLEKEQLVNWYDKDIVAGDNGDRQYINNLEDAEIIILLLSSDFLSNSFCSNVVLKKAIGRDSQNTARVIPVIIRPCLWKETELENFTVLPKNEKPVTQHPDQDQILLEIAADILKEVRKIRAAQKVDEEKLQQVPIINTLFAQPIDKKFEYNFNRAFAQLKQFNLRINKLFLSEDTLQTISDCDYLFIFSNVQEGKLFGEDDFLASKLFELNEVEDNLFAAPKVIFILSDQPIDLSKLNFPAIQTNYTDKDIVKRLLFNALIKSRIEWAKNHEKVATNAYVDDIEITKLQRGKAQIKDEETNHQLDKTYVKNFIGRERDLKSLTKKIIELKYKEEPQILTIRGTSGIGKTSLTVKAILEIAKRGYFTDGIHVLDCQHFKNFKMFEGNIANVFELDGTIDLKGDLKTRGRIDSLIILDNFENILNIRIVEDGIGIDSEESKTKATQLLKFLSDYTNIIIISWEILNQDFEDYFEVNQLNTEEALKLFEHQWGRTIQNEEERKILKEDILNKTLDRNPLAIKVIAKNIPSIKNMTALREDLKKNKFEGSEQIFNPIQYSYQTLSKREQLAFQLLFLFPDGIALRDFRECFKKSGSNTTITDRDFKNLENKSMLEVIDKKYRLQPILRRFAKIQFNKKTEEEKAPFYMDVLMFNNHFISTIEKYVGKNREEIERNFANNLLSSTKGIFELEGKDKAKMAKILPFLADGISKTLFKSIYADKVIEFCEKVINHFDDKKIYWRFTTLKLQIIYVYKSLDLGLKLFNELIPLEQLQLTDPKDFSGYYFLPTSFLNIYSIEGHSFERIKYTWKYKELYLSHRSITDQTLQFYQLGTFNYKIGVEDYNKYARDYALGKLNIDKLESYLFNLSKTNHLYRIQGYYVLAKVKPIDGKVIKRLVIINEFTKGLKLMIKAFNEKNDKLITNLFVEAIDNFKHTKYYHAEALYYLSKHCKKMEDADYTKHLSEGEAIAKKYHFRYLIHLFKNLKEGIDLVYNEADYPLPDNFNIQAVVKRYNNVVEKKTF